MNPILPPILKVFVRVASGNRPMVIINILKLNFLSCDWLGQLSVAVVVLSVAIAATFIYS